MVSSYQKEKDDGVWSRELLLSQLKQSILTGEWWSVCRVGSYNGRLAIFHAAVLQHCCRAILTLHFALTGSWKISCSYWWWGKKILVATGDALVLSTGRRIHPPFPNASPFYPPNPQDTVTGFLLAGVGHRTAQGSNFLIVKQDTQLPQIEEAFQNLTARDDVGIILINQHIANSIRHVLKDYNATIPTVLEIPSKEHPYDPEQDYIMQRVNMFLGGGM